MHCKFVSFVDFEKLFSKHGSLDVYSVLMSRGCLSFFLLFWQVVGVLDHVITPVVWLALRDIFLLYLGFCRLLSLLEFGFGLSRAGLRLVRDGLLVNLKVQKALLILGRNTLRFLFCSETELLSYLRCEQVHFLLLPGNRIHLLTKQNEQVA